MRRSAAALHLHMVLSRLEQKTSTGRRLLLSSGVTASPSPLGVSCSARMTRT